MKLGAIGSPAHVLTNDKIDSKDKGKVLAKQLKEDVKDTLTIGKVAVGAGAAATVATTFSAKAAAAFKNGLKSVMSNFGKIKVNNKSLLKKIQDSNVYKKFNVLPTQAKAGIVAAVTAAAVALPFINNIDAAKKGYIEGQAEKKK